MSWDIVKEVLSWLEPYAFVFVIAFCAYTFVLVIGRAMEFVHSFRVKNAVAFIYIIGGMFFYFEFRRGMSYNLELALNITVFSSFSMLFYMLVLWRLFDRTDGFLDKWFGKDKGFEGDNKPPSKKKKKN